MRLSKKQLGLAFVGLVAVGFLIISLNESIMRTAKTIYLIARVSPYEQTIPEGPTILVLGDSTGYGTGADKKEDSIAGLIGQDLSEYTIENNSKNGRTIGELLEVVKSLRSEHDLILLQIGGNDILQKRDINMVETELRQIIKLLGQRTENLIMISSGNVGGAVAFSGSKAKEYENLTRNFRDMFIEVSVDTTMEYVDLFVEPENDVFVQEPKTYFSWDGLHPSSAGYATWYQSLAPVLKKTLSR